MNITDIIKLISLILAISIAGERLVTMLKTMFPWLAGSTNPATPVDPKTENTRKIIVMLLAFLSCWLTASFVDGDFNPLKSIAVVTGGTAIPAVVLGLLGSGGSAFWTSLLGYTKAVSDIKVQQLHKERLEAQLAHASFESRKLENRINLAFSRIRTLDPPQFNNKTTLKLTRI